jgi:hypothetical protein
MRRRQNFKGDGESETTNDNCRYVTYQAARALSSPQATQQATDLGASPEEMRSKGIDGLLTLEAHTRLNMVGRNTILSVCLRWVKLLR